MEFVIKKLKMHDFRGKISKLMIKFIKIRSLMCKSSFTLNLCTIQSAKIKGIAAGVKSAIK